MSLIAAAPASSAARATSGRRCRRAPARPASAARPLDRRHQPRRLVVGGDRRAAAGGDRADVEQVEARLDQREAVGDRPLGGAAAGAGEERVVGDVDDPGRQRRREAELERRSASRQVVTGRLS